MIGGDKKRNQRACERFATPGLVDFVSPDESEFQYGFLINLSKQGLYVESARVFDVGTVHTLRFVLPVLDWVFEVKAKTVWNQTDSLDGKQVLEKDYGMGFFFEEMDENDLEQLDVFFDMHQRGETEITDFSSDSN